MSFRSRPGLSLMVPQPSLLQIWGPLRREDLPGLFRRACGQLAHSGGGGLIVDVEAIAPDAVAVDALARLELAARRHECRVTLRGAGPDLWRLIELTGLSAVFLSPGEGEARTTGTGEPYPEKR